MKARVGWAHWEYLLRLGPGSGASLLGSRENRALIPLCDPPRGHRWVVTGLWCRAPRGSLSRVTTYPSWHMYGARRHVWNVGKGAACVCKCSHFFTSRFKEISLIPSPHRLTWTMRRSGCFTCKQTHARHMLGIFWFFSSLQHQRWLSKGPPISRCAYRGCVRVVRWSGWAEV